MIEPVENTRSRILDIVRRQDYSALRALMDRLDPERDGDDYLVALVHQQYWHWTKGQLRGPARVCRSVLRRTEDPYVQSIAHVYLGQIEEMLGNTLQAERHHRQAARIAHHPLLVVNANNCLGLLYFNLGLHEIARELYTTGYDLGGEQWVTALSALGVARTSVGLGELELAEEWLARARRVVDRFPRWNGIDQDIHALIVRGELEAKRGEFGRARDRFQRARELASNPPRERLRLRAMESLVSASIECRRSDARALLDGYRSAARKSDVVLALHRSHRLEARLAHLSGAPHSVVLEICERISDPTQRVAAIALVGSASPAEVRMRVHDAGAELSPVVREALLAHRP